MSSDRVEVYLDSAFEYRFRRIARNGEAGPPSGEGYTRKYSAIRAVVRWCPDVARERVWDCTVTPRRLVRSTLLNALSSLADLPGQSRG